jgi:hypothetical protein
VSEGKSNRGSLDNKHIDIRDPNEVRHWAKSVGIAGIHSGAGGRVLIHMRFWLTAVFIHMKFRLTAVFDEMVAIIAPRVYSLPFDLAARIAAAVNPRSGATIMAERKPRVFLANPARALTKLVTWVHLLLPRA